MFVELLHVVQLVGVEVFILNKVELLLLFLQPVVSVEVNIFLLRGLGAVAEDVDVVSHLLVDPCLLIDIEFMHVAVEEKWLLFFGVVLLFVGMGD